MNNKIKIRRVLAVLLMAALLLEPGMIPGNPGKVHAADAQVYGQMKVTDISVSGSSSRFNKDSISLSGDSVELSVDVAVQKPQDFAVSEISVSWYAQDDEEYVRTVSNKYNVASQPSNGVYELKSTLGKYTAVDTYYLANVYVKYVNLSNVEECYELEGEPTDHYKIATDRNPVGFAWTVSYDGESYVQDETEYTGDANYTVLSSSASDDTIPKVTAIELVSASTLYSGEKTKINVTVDEVVSGVRLIEVRTKAKEDGGYETFVFEAKNEDEYTRIHTVTLESEDLDHRKSGKYTVKSVYIEDFAGNWIEYYSDDNGKKLIGVVEDEEENETKYVIDNLSYAVCNGHSYVKKLVKATTSENGSVCQQCKYCDEVKSGTKTTVYKISKVNLSYTSLVYDGKVRKPTISVYDSKGNKISSDNYSVKYPDGRKNVGKYDIKVTFKNNYKGTVYKTFTIKPEGTGISKLTKGNDKFTVKWYKRTEQITGYQICYSTDSDFENKKTKLISKKKYTSSTVKKLKSKKKYYVKIRTYKNVEVNGETTRIYSSWSKVKTVKTK